MNKKEPILRRVNKRVEAYKKANPLTPSEIMKINLVEYYEELTQRFWDEIGAEDRAVEAAHRAANQKEMIKSFKASCTNRLCLAQWEDNQTGAKFEKWNSDNGIIIIEIYAGNNGFEVYKACPFIDIDKTIKWVNQ